MGEIDIAHGGSALTPHDAPICLPAMSVEALEKVRVLQDAVGEVEQVETPMEHLLHAGMYARTMRVPPGVVIVGVLVQIDTIVIVSGDCTVFTGEETRELRGYNVLVGCAGRKQAFATHTEVCMTTLHATHARTVHEAEVEATEEHRDLLSRRQGIETTLITGE